MVLHRRVYVNLVEMIVQLVNIHCTAAWILMGFVLPVRLVLNLQRLWLDAALIMKVSVPIARLAPLVSTEVDVLGRHTVLVSLVIVLLGST